MKFARKVTLSPAFDLRIITRYYDREDNQKLQDTLKTLNGLCESYDTMLPEQRESESIKAKFAYALTKMLESLLLSEKKESAKLITDLMDLKNLDL